MAFCTKCERTVKVATYQVRGQRLRNCRSSCCRARYKRKLRFAPRAGATARP